MQPPTTAKARTSTGKKPGGIGWLLLAPMVLWLLAFVVAPTCILKAAKKPNAAKLFLEYLSSADASKIAVDTFGESIHDSVQPKAGPPLSGLKTMIAPPDKLLKGLADVKEKWRDTFGI